MHVLGKQFRNSNSLIHCESTRGQEHRYVLIGIFFRGMGLYRNLHLILTLDWAETGFG